MDQLYQTAFRRPCDEVTRASRIDFLQRGGSPIALIGQLFASAEYSNRYPNNADYVEALFVDGLGRPSDAAGKAGYVSQLARGVSRASIAQQIVGSQEHIQMELGNLYQQYLGRPADPVGLQNAANAVRNGASLSSISAFLLASEEAQLQNRLQRQVQTLDTDQDGLLDAVENGGWDITVTQLNGALVTRHVTSDPNTADSDGDGVSDRQEATINTDPRSKDTDLDQLSDLVESTQIFTDPTNQDTDSDGLDDNAEFNFFLTSPFQADTDGDQIRDGAEVLGNRNPRISDLPRPEISVSDIALRLNVKFTETKSDERRELETQQLSTTLQSSQNQSHSNSDTTNFDAHLDAGYEPGGGGKGPGFISGGVSSGFTFQSSDESARASEQTYQNSLTTDKEVTQGSEVERSVENAVIQATVSLRNVSTLAYRVKNLQVTAFIQDPRDHTKLTPVATLLPDSEPAEGYTLGPLVTDRGPFVFTNTTAVPSLVESLMANPSGLVFRISNYDIIDEAGRNFAFSSQDVSERTARLTLDFGGARSIRAQVGGQPINENQPGDETEIYRVATSGGRLFDTNGDGTINGNDQRVIFNPSTGKEVGITLPDAFTAIGLTRYEARLNPATGQYQEFVPGGMTPVNLTFDQMLTSYSTFIAPAVGASPAREKIYRIHAIANDSVNQKFWEILTPKRIDSITSLGNLILKTDSPVSINFVQDLDGDGLTADVEYLLGTSDSPELVSGASLPVTFQQTNNVRFADGVNFSTGTPVRVSVTQGGLTAGTTYYLRKDGGSNPYSFYNTAANAIAGGTSGRISLTTQIANVIPMLPKGRDTDGDGLDDAFEATQGWTVNVAGRTTQVYSSAKRADSNFDGISDLAAAPAGWTDSNNNGFRDPGEVSQNGASDFVLDPSRPDTDQDGISDFAEINGFSIKRITDGSTITRTTSPVNPDTDGDTFSDGFEQSVGLDPTSSADRDTDGDGLPDPVEQNGWRVGSTRSEIQTVTLDPNHDTSFTLIFGASSTPTFANSATAADVATALNNLNSIRNQNGVVTVTRSGNVFTIAFGGGLTGMDVPQLTSTGSANFGVTIQQAGVESVSVDPYTAGPATSPLVRSLTNSVDSDGDGLTDFEEFFLKTSPISVDTDQDGISDFLELNGYRLGHLVSGKDLGIIKTDPLDADTDNDKLSDGQEAELTDVEQQRWTVRVVGQDPYQVFSNPLVADSDFDQLVDGEERTQGSDPNKGNTDGDSRDDGVEFNAHTNPLVKDFQVTAFFTTLTFTDDADSGSPGDIGFNFGIRTPDRSQPAGLSSVLTSVVKANLDITAPFRYTLSTGISDLETARGSTSSEYGIQISAVPPFDVTTLNFANLVPDQSQRSVSFGMTLDDVFSIEGAIVEVDGNNTSNYCSVYLGGLEGTLATDNNGSARRAVFTGSELIQASSKFHDVVFNFSDANNSFTGSTDGFGVDGNMKMFFVVTS